MKVLLKMHKFYSKNSITGVKQNDSTTKKPAIHFYQWVTGFPSTKFKSGRYFKQLTQSLNQGIAHAIGTNTLAPFGENITGSDTGI